MALPILLVEQDAIVRRFVRRALENGGFRVYEAATLKEAMEGIRTQPDPFVLVVADVFAMNGRKRDALIPRKFRKAALPILYLSTMSEQWLHEKELLRADDRFLSKPFSPKELIAKVREVLGLPDQN